MNTALTVLLIWFITLVLSFASGLVIGALVVLFFIATG